MNGSISASLDVLIINAVQTEQNVHAARGVLNGISFNPIRVIVKYFHRGNRVGVYA